MKRSNKKTAPKKMKKASTTKAKRATTKVIPPSVPVLATKEGLKLLQHHCEGIMELVGDLLVTNNPKISQKDFKSEAHDLIRIFFGMDKAAAKATAKKAARK